jgi:hypothetical protein
MIFQSQVARPSTGRTPLPRQTHRQLQRKCACGGTPGPTGECEQCKHKRLSLQPKLAINTAGDRYEQEADQVAETIMRGGIAGRNAISSLGQGSAVQRDEPAKPKTEEEKYKEAAKKAGEAFLETAPGKEIKKKAEELGDEFVSTLPGKVITGATIAGAVTALAVTHKELPIGIPEIPLDKIKPGLKMKITYEGPVDKPTKVTATFSFSFGGGKSSEKKRKQTESEKFRAETAKMAAEQETFREGLKPPEQKAAEQRMFDEYIRSKMLGPGQLTPRTSPLSFGVAGQQLGFQPGTPTSGLCTSLGPWAPDSKLTGETTEEPKKKDEQSLQRKSAGPSEVSQAPAIVDEVLKSSGEPLEPVTRMLMEERFGYDFGNVRIHRDARANESAKSVNALAWTVGRDVVFAANNYAPTSTTGRRLIAHELTHVVQQSSRSEPLTAETIEIGPAHDACEEEAEACATSVATDVTLTASPQRTASRPCVQRFAPFEFIGDIFTEGPVEAFARLFGEGEFSEQELLQYLGKLDQGKTEGRYDSDNKARAVVRLWKVGNPKIKLNPPRKKLLIREMWQGSTSKGDAEGILDLLERSFPEDVTVIFGPGGVAPKDLFDSFSAADQGRLQQFFDQRVDGGLKAALEGKVKPTDGVTVAPYLNDQTMRQRWLAGLDKGLNLLTQKIAAGDCAFPQANQQDFDKKNWMLDKSQARQEERIKFNRQGIAPISAAPFQAVDLLFGNLDKWTCDCRLFGELAMLFAWHEALADSPVAFNNKFANLVLTPETTTGLEREVIQTDPAAVLENPKLDTDRLWKEAPVGTKVAWKNESPSAKAPFEFEHAIKTFHFGPGRDELYAAHPFSTPQKRDLTEKEIVEALAQAAPDFPWAFEVTGGTMTMLPAEGVDPPIVASLASLQGQRFKDQTTFLNAPPLLALRQQAKQDPPRFSRIINLILKHTRTPSSAAATEAYIAKNIIREKIEVPK